MVLRMRFLHKDVLKKITDCTDSKCESFVLDIKNHNSLHIIPLSMILKSIHKEIACVSIVFLIKTTFAEVIIVLLNNSFVIVSTK